MTFVVSSVTLTNLKPNTQLNGTNNPPKSSHTTAQSRKQFSTYCGLMGSPMCETGQQYNCNDACFGNTRNRRIIVKQKISLNRRIILKRRE
jgi:hypothetical protein